MLINKELRLNKPEEIELTPERVKELLGDFIRHSKRTGAVDNKALRKPLSKETKRKRNN